MGPSHADKDPDATRFIPTRGPVLSWGRADSLAHPGPSQLLSGSRGAEENYAAYDIQRNARAR